jgi:hypothetical protein
LEPESGYVGFVVYKAVLGEGGHVFSEYFGFPLQSFHRLPHTRRHPSSSGTGTVASVIVDTVPLHPKEQEQKQ